MKEFILFFLTFFLVYLIYYVFIMKRKKQLKKYRESTEVHLLNRLYQVNVDQISDQQLIRYMACANALIIAFTIYITHFISNVMIGLLLGFIVVIALIFLIYGILGFYLRKKYGTKKKTRKKE